MKKRKQLNKEHKRLAKVSLFFKIMNKSNRDLRLDVIRLFAFFCVVSVHFFLNSNFYKTDVYGLKMFIMIIARSFFIICVPLFIMLTGYLMNKKELSKKYYKGIIKILIIYLICSIIYHIFSYFYLSKEVTIYSFFDDLFVFKGTYYSWYVNLYIGLFLMIPFLNMIFANLKDKKTFNYLLITLFILTGLPSTVNLLCTLLPTYWVGIYPILYYYLGAYIYKYKPDISIKKCILFLAIILSFEGIVNFTFFFGKYFEFIPFNDYFSGLVILTAFITFVLLLKLKINYTPRKEKILKTLSDAVFGAYLLSCIFDRIFYDCLFKSTLYAPLIIALVYSLSLLSSIIINVIYNKVKSIIIKQ